MYNVRRSYCCNGILLLIHHYGNAIGRAFARDAPNHSSKRLDGLNQCDDHSHTTPCIQTRLPAELGGIASGSAEHLQTIPEKGKAAEELSRHKQLERVVTVRSMIMVVVFCVEWTPYFLLMLLEVVTGRQVYVKS